MPSCMAASHVFQPEPASPMRFATGTRMLSKTTLYWVSEPMLLCWVISMPADFGSTSSRSTPSSPSSVRNEHHQPCGAAREGHVPLRAAQAVLAAV